jgi:hypothetical protein
MDSPKCTGPDLMRAVWKWTTCSEKQTSANTENLDISVHSSWICNSEFLKNRNQLGSSSVGEWLNKWYYIHSMEYYLVMKRNTLCRYTTWVDLQRSTLCKKSQSPKIWILSIKYFWNDKRILNGGQIPGWIPKVLTIEIYTDLESVSAMCWHEWKIPHHETLFHT